MPIFFPEFSLDIVTPIGAKVWCHYIEGVSKPNNRAAHHHVTSIQSQSSHLSRVLVNRMTKGSQRKRLSLEEKLQVARYVKDGKSQTEAALHFGISRPAVNQIVKESEILKAQLEKSSGNAGRKSLKSARSSCLEDALHQWNVRAEIDAPDLNITGEVLQNKALEFRDKILNEYENSLTAATKQYLKNFKASNSWLQIYVSRKGTTSRRRCGESSSTNTEAIADRLGDIRRRLENVPLHHIWNIDETALQHRTTSSRYYMTINSDGRGVKRSKERLTVTPLVSGSGEKLTVQIIGKSKTPRALRGIEINRTYNVVYDHQSKAWQDGSSMLRLLHRINREAKRRRQMFFVLLDNCSSHVFCSQNS